MKIKNTIGATALILLCSCAIMQPQNPDAVRIMIMNAIPSQQYEVLGSISARANTLLFFYVRPEEANAALQSEAYRRWGTGVDAIIGVQYHEIKGLTTGETIGTTAIGTAIRYTNK